MRASLRIPGDQTSSSARTWTGPGWGFWDAVYLGILGLIWALFCGLALAPSACRASTFSVTAGADSLTLDSAAKDSLIAHIKRHAGDVLAVTDSLAQAWGMEEDARLNMEAGIEGISEFISEIGSEFGDLDLKISDNRISFTDETGDGITVRITDNLEDISHGLRSLTQVILSELPDSIKIDETRVWNWKGLLVAPPPPERKIVHGNVIKVGDNLHLTANEDVRGDVVVVFGSAQISGRVDGNVVVILGDCQLDESAEVTGQLITVLGRLEQDEGAPVGDIVVIDPWQTGLGGGLPPLMGGGTGLFLASQVSFFLMALLAILAVVAAPRKRLYNTLATLQGKPGSSLGFGILVAFLGYLAAVVLVTVLVLTVIGIPLALVVVVALGVMMVIATAVAGVVLGSRVCRWVVSECGPLWVQALIGVTLLHGVCFLGGLLGLNSELSGLGTAIFITGAVIKCLAFLFGLGALVTSRFGSHLVSEKAPITE